ncbi:hypothetical protein [Acinetobacter indicus]|uniref:hypothetical protein n=1 Tax=Acinetobacter indicus TaxID=756892 RepID=UPI0032B5E10D
MPTVVKQRLLHILNDVPETYFDLVSFYLDADIAPAAKQQKALFSLKHEIETLPLALTDFPSQLDQLEHWMIQHEQQAQLEFEHYLKRRAWGQPREYFHCLSDAYEFLIKITPTQRAQAAWLYSFSQHWDDRRYTELIQLYLQALAYGHTQQHQLYQFNALLETLQLDNFVLGLEDGYFHQAAIQLALAYCPADFMPLTLGFHIGKHLCSLHQLIIAHELKELGIHTRCFQPQQRSASRHTPVLHAIASLAPGEKQQAQYLRLIQLGYGLSQQGMNEEKVLQRLHLHDIIQKIFQHKALMGKFIHDNKCIFTNRSINQWLETVEGVDGFIQQLLETDWIRLGQDPEQSKFWRLIHQQESQMFGLFNRTEQQFIYDWILGDAAVQHPAPSALQSTSDHFKTSDHFNYMAELELEEIQLKYAQASSFDEKIRQLLPYLAPHKSASDAGRWCTQQYSQALFPALSQALDPMHHKS